MKNTPEPRTCSPMAGIITSKETSASNPLNLPVRTICHVCQKKQFSQYTCPRCNSRYCSLECYKMQTVACRRRLSRKLSGSPISLNDPSAEERKLFQQAMVSGELSKMIPRDPWWTKPSARIIRLGPGGKRPVQPLALEEASGSSKSEEDNSSEEEFPVGPESPLALLSKLTTAEPSLFLIFHLVDIIFNYCFTLCLYNGDWQSDPLVSAMVVLSVSSVLGNGGQPESKVEAISNCLEQACSPAYRHVGAPKFGMAFIDDVVTLLSLGTPALICSLSDLRRLLEAGLAELKQEMPKGSRSLEVKSMIKSATRKVYIVMCWVNERPAEVWSTTLAILDAEKCAIIQQSGVEKANGGEKVDKGRKVLIEEVQ